jgi:hypothetical protein
MQTLCSASVPLRMMVLALMMVGVAAGWPLRAVAAGAPAKVHVVNLGAVKKVPYLPAEAGPGVRARVAMRRR